MMSPLVDSSAKIVAFDYPPIHAGVLLSQMESDVQRGITFEESIPQSIDEGIVKPWVRALRKHHIGNLPIVEIDQRSLAYDDARKWAERALWPDISGNRDLGGFSLDDFRLFYVHMWLCCRCITRLEDMVDSALGHEHLLGSRLLQGRRQYIEYWLSQFCELPHGPTKCIVDRLTFNLAQRHPILSGHPFVPAIDGSLTLLARLFVRTDPTLMLSMALNTGATRPLYEAIIGEIEVAAKRRLAQLLRERGYAVWDRPSLPRAGMDPLTPDLVVGRADDDWIAVVEYKHALPPRGAAAVSDRIKEATKWIDKAKRYLLAARPQSERVQTQLGFAVRDRRLIVSIVPRWPMPVPIIIDSEDIYMVDLGSVERAAGETATVSEVFAPVAAYSQPAVKRAYHAIMVGDWTYKHPILVPATSADTRHEE